MKKTEMTEPELIKLIAEADGGDAEAQFKIGDYYLSKARFTDEETEAFADKAFGYLYDAAQKKHPAATALLGSCFFYGLGAAQDKAKGMEYYKESAKLGNTEAMLLIGDFLTDGYSVEEDPHTALVYLNMALEKGEKDAYILIGRAYNKMGENLKALKWYETAAEKGIDDAYYYIAVCYQYGDGVKEDIQQAAYWYGKGAEKKDSSCIKNLADFYYEGEKGLEKDENRAFELYKQIFSADWSQSSKGDDEESIFNDDSECIFLYWKHCITALVELYKNDEKRRTQEDAAFVELWFNRGASAGIAIAQYALAKYYYEGDFLPRNYDLAFALMNRALSEYDVSEEDEAYSCSIAEQRELDPEIQRDALLIFADLLEKGYGSEEERTKFKDYESKIRNRYVINGKDDDAINKNSNWQSHNAKGGKFLSSKTDKFIDWVMRAEKGELDAMFKAGECSFKGYGTNVDFDKAFDYLTKFTDATDKLEGYFIMRGQAYKILSTMYGKGKGVKKDKIKAGQYKQYAKQEKKKGK